MVLQSGRAAAIMVAAVAAMAGWIMLAVATAGDESAVDARPRDETNRSPDRSIDPAVVREPPASLATKKKVDEEVRELLRQTDELDEESEDDLHGDAPLPSPPPDLSR